MFQTRIKYLVFDSAQVNVPLQIVFSKALDNLFKELSKKVALEYMFYLKEVKEMKVYYPIRKVMFTKQLSESDFEEYDALYIPFQSPIIPRQERTYAEVELKETPPQDISIHGHKHPSTVTDFSGTDHEYLLPQGHNILVTDGGIQKFTLRIPVSVHGSTIMIIVKDSRDELLFYDDVREVTGINDMIEKIKSEIEEKTVNETRSLYEFPYRSPSGYPYRYMHIPGDDAEDEMFGNRTFDYNMLFALSDELKKKEVKGRRKGKK